MAKIDNEIVPTFNIVQIGMKACLSEKLQWERLVVGEKLQKSIENSGEKL